MCVTCNQLLDPEFPWANKEILAAGIRNRVLMVKLGIPLRPLTRLNRWDHKVEEYMPEEECPNVRIAAVLCLPESNFKSEWMDILGRWGIKYEH